MGKSYSSDLRERISEHVAAGHGRRDAARRFGVSPSCAIKLTQRVARTGSAAPARQGRPPGAGKFAPHAATLARWVDAKSDITMFELSAKLEAGESEEEGVIAICADAGDFLEDLLKSFQFEGRRVPGLNRLYPRLIRAMDDQWARSADHARYTSPIARFVWKYIEHINRGVDDDDDAAEAFDYAATGEDGRVLAGHEALLGVIDFLRIQIEQLAAAEHRTLSIPPLEVIVDPESTVMAELWPHRIPPSVGTYLDEEDEDEAYEDATVPR